MLLNPENPPILNDVSVRGLGYKILSMSLGEGDNLLVHGSPPFWMVFGFRKREMGSWKVDAVRDM
jgi:hypothetical protein